MYLVFTRTPGKSYGRQLRSLLLCLCDVFQVLFLSIYNLEFLPNFYSGISSNDGVWLPIWQSNNKKNGHTHNTL